MPGAVVRVAVAGLGNWGANVVRSFSAAQQAELACVCDSSPRALENARRLYPQARTTADFESVLDDSGIDAVAVVTPAGLHHAMAKAALLAGKHVFVEKPMTLTVDEAEDLVRTADRQDRKLMVGHLLEYHPAIDWMKQYIDRGELGQVYYMYCQRLNLGVVRQHENALWSLAPHDISIILYLLGAEPESVVASGACFLQADIEDVVFANLRFPDGRLAQFHVSWLDPNKARTMVVVGSKKMLVFDDMHPSEKIRVFDKGATLEFDASSELKSVSVRHGDIHIPHIGGRQPLDIETQHFINSIINDTTPRSDGRDGLRVVRVLEDVDRQFRATLPINAAGWRQGIRVKAA